MTTSTFKLPSGTEVTIKSSLTWGEKESLKLEIQKGAKIGNGGVEGYDFGALLEEKFKILECVVVGMKLPDGKEVPFTREWMKNVDADEGDALFDAVNAVYSKKKEA